MGIDIHNLQYGRNIVLILRIYGARATFLQLYYYKDTLST